jgi:sugar diacid utilization regulator
MWTYTSLAGGRTWEGRLVTMSVPVLRTWMRAVSEISRAVNVAEPVDAILTGIADQARDLIGFDFCAVMLVDSAADRLEIVGSSGLSPDYVEELRDDSSLQIHPTTPDADSPAARALRTNRTVSISDVRRDVELYGRLSLSTLQGYNSLVASPLRGEEAPIGVLVGYSSAPRIYGQPDRELTELLAEQTAAAVQTARLRARRAWAEQQHRRLMQLVLDDVDIHGLVESLSEVLDAPVAVTDSEGKTLAASGQADWEALWEELAPNRFGPDREASNTTRHVQRNGGDAWIAPVVLTGTVSAHLWVLGDRAVTDTTRRRLVEQFALVVGIEMLTTRHALEIEERLSADLLSDVLGSTSNTLPPVLLERGNALGFDLEDSRNVVLVRGEALAEHRSAVARQVREGLLTKILATSNGDQVVILVSETRDLMARLDKIRRQIRDRTSRAVTIVVGPPIQRAGDIRSAYQAASGAARLRTATDMDGLIDLRNLSVLGLLLTADAPTIYLRQLADQLVKPVAELDQRRDTQLVATLRVWLGSGHSVAKTAAALTVHVNTVGQRLARIEKLTRRDLKAPDTRLDLQLALHVWDICNARPTNEVS